MGTEKGLNTYCRAGCSDIFRRLAFGVRVAAWVAIVGSIGVAFASHFRIMGAPFLQKLEYALTRYLLLPVPVLFGRLLHGAG